MAFLTKTSLVRSVEWSKSYLWDIRFPTAPNPFTEWFPASDVDENLAVLDSFSFSAGANSFKIPKSATNFTIRVTFSDDANNTLIDWLTTWINTTILNGGDYVSTLEAASKPLLISKLDNARNEISIKSYLVYPEDSITFSGTSESKLNIYAITFIVVGIIGENRQATTQFTSDNDANEPESLQIGPATITA